MKNFNIQSLDQSSFEYFLQPQCEMGDDMIEDTFDDRFAGCEGFDGVHERQGYVDSSEEQ